MPPNPKMAAIIAITKKINVQRNIVKGFSWLINSRLWIKEPYHKSLLSRGNFKSSRSGSFEEFVLLKDGTKEESLEIKGKINWYHIFRKQPEFNL
jgi:hypothetical protein